MSASFLRNRFVQSSWRTLLVSLWLLALVCDLIYLANPQQQVWHSLAFYGIGAGLLLGSVVAAMGFAAWVRISDPHWRAIGVAHITAYLMVGLLLGLSLILRVSNSPSILAAILSGVAIALFLSSTWIDDELEQLYRQRHSLSWPG